MDYVPTVYLVDDDRLLRRSLVDLIGSIGLKVQASESAESFFEMFDREQAGCIVSDVCLPQMSGLELQSRLREDRVSTPLIFLSGHADVTMAVEAMAKGAFHFFEKPVRTTEFLQTVRDALKKDFDERAEHQKRKLLESRYETLTGREVEVINLIVDGASNREAAAALGVAERTVETHRAHAMAKLQAGSLAEAIKSVLVLRQNRNSL